MTDKHSGTYSSPNISFKTSSVHLNIDSPPTDYRWNISTPSNKTASPKWISKISSTPKLFLLPRRPYVRPPLARSLATLRSFPSNWTASQLTESTAPPNTLSALPPRQQQHQLLQPLDTLAIDRQLFPAFPHSPVKTYNAWEQNEDDLLITLRGSGMKWEDIANMMPGRTAIACRLHYQNYLEHPLSWNTEIKDKLAKLYVRWAANSSRSRWCNTIYSWSIKHGMLIIGPWIW